MEKSKISQLKQLIREVVGEELEAIIPDVITEFGKVIDQRVEILLTEFKQETGVEIKSLLAELKTPPLATKLNRQKLSEMVGLQLQGDTVRATTANVRAPSPINDTPTIQGTEEVVRAITRDYSDVMAKLNELRPDIKGVYR